ncbi:uncharacterized protein tafa5l isoform X1 [Channa argus]|uniref:uncharacterized protein tafa5l isoform X1 n=1 Tax=Channa argus TaxID=215402 RepID=UPI003520E7BC
MQSGVKTLSAGGGASLCCLLLLWLIYSHLLREGQLAVGTCEIVMLNRDSSVPRRTIARQTARCACRRGQIAGTTRARPACVDASTLSSPVDIQRIVVPLLSFNLPTMLPRSTMCCPGGSWPGRSSGPGQVRRELITFQCCFSTLCKEQSVLITVDYRRMLIQCHAEGLQRESESITA